MFEPNSVSFRMSSVVRPRRGVGYNSRRAGRKLYAVTCNYTRNTCCFSLFRRSVLWGNHPYFEVIPTFYAFFEVTPYMIPTLQSHRSNDPNRMKRKFSSFFKSLVIELDKDLYGPDNHLVEVRFTNFQS